MKTSLACFVVPSLALLLSTVCVSGVVPIPAEVQHVKSLDGVWRFKLEQAPAPPHFLGANGKPIPANYPTNFESFYLPAYREDSSWHPLPVPGNWEMAGFSPATYHQPDNASGFYRLRFEVPSAWKGRLVKINFDGVQNGCEIWCNGKPVAAEVCSWGQTNYHECGWTAWQADLTPAVKFGTANLLALRVIKNTKGVDCDTGDFFFLGGVHRPVTLFSLPPSHLQDLTIRTKLLEQGAAEVTVIAQLNQPTKSGKISMHLEGQPALEAEPDPSGRAVLTQTVRNAKLWSAEFPNLYKLAVDLKEGSKVREHVERRVGIREVSTADGVFRVNGVPVKLVGICRHDVYPTLGTAVGPEVWKKDLTLMKAANFNAIRTSHYPYGSGFYDLCDEMGFYVLDEEPFCWVNCDDPVLMPAFEQRARETVARDKNHPCVVIWGIGNENKPGRDNTLAAHLTRELDPTRPRLVSCQKAEDGGADVQFDDEHYITPKSIARAEHSPRRANIPMIYTENPNVWDVRNGPDYGSLDMWAPVIDRTWREIWNDEHVCGTFLWEWQDRAVTDKCPTKYYYYFPDTGINLLKVKGVVDGFRNPRPEYYHIKMAQTPIALGTNLQVLANAAVLDANNRYSFTDLKDLQVHWQLLKDSRRLAEADTKASLPPRSKGELRLALPGQSLSAADTLRVEVIHPAGWNVVTCEFPLKPVAHIPPAVQAVSGLKFPKFIFLTGKRVRDNMGWWKLDGQAGELVGVKIQRRGTESVPVDSAALTDLRLADVASLEADVTLPSNSVPVAHLHAEISGGKLNYQFTWNGEKSDIYELGWEFAGPKGVDRFSWDRQALWSYYPPNHIGRPRGTAMPDSGRAELTKVERPDAFDFNSTKFNCNWASLTDSSGHGLCCVFSPEQRQHVRGAVDAKGNCSLIVNRCYSPPRDISSPIVEDLYTVLKKGETVEGSFEINSLTDGSANKGSARLDSAPTPGSPYHIYAGNTHAHTMYTWSHGEQFVSRKAQKGKQASGIAVSGEGVQGPSANEIIQADWHKFQGSPAEHYARAKTNGYDFYAVTDHSQESAFAPTCATNAAWVTSLRQAAEATDASFVALSGHEHSENNGPGGKGHLNVYNSSTYLNALSPGVDLPALYKWLKTVPPNGEGPVVACFNHPGAHQYNDWADRDPQVTDIITLLEVINSNKGIHYDAFVNALDKGWKVSPVCGNDNHGFYGITHHTSRTFVLATSKTKSAILEAMQHRRTYASLDRNLQCQYSVNGAIMGSTLEQPSRFKFDISVSDPDANEPKDRITKLDVVEDGGAVAASYAPDPAFSIRWTPEIENATNRYFFVRVWNAGGGDAPGADPAKPIAWLAPVWTGR